MLLKLFNHSRAASCSSWKYEARIACFKPNSVNGGNIAGNRC